MQWIAVALVALVTLSARPLRAQEVEPDLPRQSAALPVGFSRFTAADVLAKLFPDYVAATGRVPSILDEDEKPAKVWLGEAKPWQVEQLVVVVRIAADAAEASEGLCGGCLGHALIGVVGRQGDALVKVAFGRAPKSLTGNDGEPDDMIGYSGHGGLSLDLAPYALTAKEMLIGLRQDMIWREIRSEGLTLYRIVDGRPHAVFHSEVADFDYPEYDRLPRRVIKTTAIVAPVPSAKGYYDLRVTRTVIRCTDRNDDDDCNAKDEPVQRVRRTTELWRFGGEEYAQVKGK
jgi:hypothetical protein